MYKIAIASDSFKGSLSSMQIASILARAFAEYPEFAVKKIPIADGGEGTLAVLAASLEGQIIKIRTTSPLPAKKTTAEYLVFYENDKKCAIIELAQTAGLQLIANDEKKPLLTTTYGVGEMINAALSMHCERIYITLGGSVTCDGGIGMAQALGYKFAGIEDKICTGRDLNNITGISIPLARKRLLQKTEFVMLADVTNPLFGENGAAKIYAPQKGADKNAVNILENGIINLNNTARAVFGFDAAAFEGAGAAGGAGAGGVYFLNAEIKNGISEILRIIDFPDRIKDCDAVITGEGKVDSQTASGKAITGIIAEAKRQNKLTIVVAGSIELTQSQLQQQIGADLYFPLCHEPATLNECIENAEVLLYRIGITIARYLKAQ